jgi:hypothetical protein
MLAGGADALTEPTDLLLGDGREDVPDEVRHLPSFTYRVCFDVEAGQLLTCPDTFGDAPAEAVEGRDDDSHRLPLRAHRPYFDHQSLVVRAIVPGAGHYVGEFRPDRPSHAGSVVATLSELGIEGDALARLLVTADACVDECRDHARSLLRYPFHVDLLFLGQVRQPRAVSAAPGILMSTVAMAAASFVGRPRGGQHADYQHDGDKLLD